jgi:peptidoglycan/xylan/chitin deacetylase (PgdA/CDA1 family)
MYHVVATRPAHAANPDLYVSPEEFVAQLRYLQSHGYEAVTLQQVYDFWTGRGSLPQHPVVLSFDDGNESAFTTVAPLLDSVRWPGVLNMIVGEQPGTMRLPLPEARALVAHGWEIDSHTLDHVDVTTLSDAELKRQLEESKRSLQQQLGVKVNFFCYPFGAHDER